MYAFSRVSDNIYITKQPCVGSVLTQAQGLLPLFVTTLFITRIPARRTAPTGPGPGPSLEYSTVFRACLAGAR